MSAESKQAETIKNDVTDYSVATYTQIACCAIGNYTSPLMRQSLRDKLEREREERKQRQQKSFSLSFRNLFG